MTTNWKEVEIGLAKYRWIMKALRRTDVSTDREFQKRFNHFYRMRQRTPAFYRVFYAKLQESKEGDPPTFGEVLDYFWRELGRVEASFSSKLVATIDPDLPVWDREVLRRLGLKTPAYASKKRLDKAKELYEVIKNWYQAYLGTEAGNAQISEFDRRFPNSGISDIKKIDFILWQTRSD